MARRRIGQEFVDDLYRRHFDRSLAEALDVHGVEVEVRRNIPYTTEQVTRRQASDGSLEFLTRASEAQAGEVYQTATGLVDLQARSDPSPRLPPLADVPDGYREGSLFKFRHCILAPNSQWKLADPGAVSNSEQVVFYERATESFPDEVPESVRPYLRPYEGDVVIWTYGPDGGSAPVSEFRVLRRELVSATFAGGPTRLTMVALA